MSSRYNKYRKTSNYPYRKGSSYKSSVSKRSSGNIKAAFEQRDQCEVVLNCNNVINCNFGTDADPKSYAVSAVNVFDALYHSQFYANYAPMYDQVRIDKVKAKITSLEFPHVSERDSYTNISVVTAFDRNGLDALQLAGFNTNGTYEGNNGYITQGTAIGKDISTYSSALTKNLSFGSTFEVIRYITPFTVQEKSQYIATDSLRQWYRKYDENNNWFVIDNSEESNLYKNAVSRNPCYLERNEAIPFKPTYLVGVIGLDKLRGKGACIFNIELDVCCTFRGLRKSQTV